MRKAVLLGLALVLAGCAGGDRPPREPPEDKGKPFHPPIEILERYDADHDGTITRAEMEAGLKADFDAADTNHDGRLDADETRAVNEQRWSENASTTSTVVDWNQDGFVEFHEFAGTARSLFAELDADGDGKLTPKEIAPHRPGKKTIWPSRHM
jgi:hypothetical protein